MNIEAQGKWEWKSFIVPLEPSGLPHTTQTDQLIKLCEDGWYPDCVTPLPGLVWYLLVREIDTGSSWK